MPAPPITTRFVSSHQLEKSPSDACEGVAWYVVASGVVTVKLVAACSRAYWFAVVFFWSVVGFFVCKQQSRSRHKTLSVNDLLQPCCSLPASPRKRVPSTRVRTASRFKLEDCPSTGYSGQEARLSSVPTRSSRSLKWLGQQMQKPDWMASSTPPRTKLVTYTLGRRDTMPPAAYAPFVAPRLAFAQRKLEHIENVFAAILRTMSTKRKRRTASSTASSPLFASRFRKRR